MQGVFDVHKKDLQWLGLKYTCKKYIAAISVILTSNINKTLGPERHS